MSGIVEVFNKGVGRIVLSLLLLVLLTGAVNAVSPNYAELTSPIGFKNNTTSAIAFADIPKDGLVLWLPFDEGWGYVAHDWSGLNNSGTGYINATASTLGINWTVGVQGGAWKGDGVDDYVKVPDSTSLSDISNGFTIVAWVYPVESDRAQTIVIKLNASINHQYRVFIRASNVWGFTVQGDLNKIDDSGTSVTYNTWQMVALTYNTTTATANFYVDGVLTKQVTLDVGTINLVGVPLYIGSNPVLYRFNGSIDNVMIYNRALSDEEIKKIYEATKPKYDINKGLVLYLPFDEMSGTVAHDLSGNGNDGQGYSGSTAQINWTAGIFGGAWKGDGVDDYVEVSDSPELNSENFTVAGWVNVKLPHGGKYTNAVICKAVFKAPPDGKGWYVRFSGQNGLTLTFGVYFNESEPQIGYTITEGNWYFFTAVKDGNTLKLYINGELVKTGTGTGVYVPPDGVALKLGTPGAYHGLIDEVRIYNRALNDSEIKYLYELGKSKLHLEKGLVLHLTFDEGVGNVTYNYAMTNITINKGTFYGNTSANWTTGVVGKAIKFDGVDDYVALPSDIKLSNKTLTITAWVNPRDNSNTHVIFQKDRYVATKTGVHFVQDYRKLGIHVANGSVCEYVYAGGVFTELNKWYFVVAVVDLPDIKLYVNGDLVKEATVPITKITYEDYWAGIGKTPANTEFFDGLIDDVRIYNRVLSPEEIKALYLLTKNKYDSEFTIVNYTVSITPETPNKLKFALTPQNELTDIQKLVFLPANAIHTYKTISTETDGYGNTLQVVETSDESLSFEVEIPDLSPAPDGVAMAVWEYKGTLRAVADPNVYSQIEIDWGIFHWILDNFTQMFIHRNNELKVGDLFEFPDVQLTIVASGYISSTDPIEKTDKGLVISGSEFSAIPSADTVIYLEEFNPDKIREGTGSLLAKFTVDTQYHDQTIKFIITGLPANTNFTVYKNGTFLKYVVTNESGVLEFEDTGFSPTEITIELTSPPALALAPPEISLEGALSYASYTIAGILVFLIIAFIVRKLKGE